MGDCFRVSQWHRGILIKTNHISRIMIGPRKSVDKPTRLLPFSVRFLNRFSPLSLIPLHLSWHRVTHYVRNVSWIRMRMSMPSRRRGDAFTLSWMIERTTNHERATTDCQILNIFHGPPSRMKTDCEQRSSGNWIEQDKRECLDVLIWIFWWISRVYLQVWIMERKRKVRLGHRASTRIIISSVEEILETLEKQDQPSAINITRLR